MSRRADPRTYRQIAEQDWGILMCSSHIGCRKSLSESAHVHGKLDRANVIHLSRADGHVRRTGLRVFLKLIARALNPTWEVKPLWHRLYLENTWAFKTARLRYHTMIPAEESFDDRAKAERASRRSSVKLRSQHFMIYQWIRHDRVYTRPTSKA